MVLLSGMVLVATGFTLPGAMPTETPARAAVSMNFFAGLQQGLAKAMAGNYDEAAVKANLERQIKMKPAILYGTTTCPFCAKAQEEITSMGAILSVYAFDEEEEGPAMKAELMKITGQSSVPQVFVGGEFIGGCNDGGIGGVVPLNGSGKLEEKLIKAGALVPGARI